MVAFDGETAGRSESVASLEEDAVRTTGTGDRVGTGGEGAAADPQVQVKATRRRFSPEYKLRILREADGCGVGELGPLLRREGLYHSRLQLWRRQREQGELAALGTKRRGPGTRPDLGVLEELDGLRGENARLRERLERTEAIIAVQKKLSQLLGISLSSAERSGCEF